MRRRRGRMQRRSVCQQRWPPHSLAAALKLAGCYSSTLLHNTCTNTNTDTDKNTKTKTQTNTHTEVANAIPLTCW